MSYNYNEDKSRTLVCEHCGCMVHTDYTAEHDAFHAKIRDDIRDGSLATLKVVRDEMRGGLDRLSEDLRHMSNALDQYVRHGPVITQSNPNDLGHIDKKS